MNSLRPTDSSPETDFTLYDGLGYVEALTRLAHQTERGDRLALSTMSLEPSEQPVDQLLPALAESARRGTDVTLLVDSYALLVDSGSRDLGPLLIPYTSRTFAQRLNALDSLQEAGVTVALTNEPPHYLSNPFAGRSHIKGAVINDSVFLGGPNLHDVDRIDASMQITNPDLADFLYDILGRIAKSGQTKQTITDGRRPFADGSSLLFDAGYKNQSHIQGTARRLIASVNEADQLLLATQFVPRGALVKDLAAAHERGADISLIFTPPSGKNAVMSASERFAFHALKRALPSALMDELILPTNKPVHAKCIVTPRQVLIGSHNFDPRGIKFGTAEIAYLRQSTDLGKILAKHLLGQC